MNNCFHYAFKVRDLKSTRFFYGDILGCREGRSANTWIDFDFFGHQITAHMSDIVSTPDYCGEVDGIPVPIPHFGCLFTEEQFHLVKKKLEDAEIAFIIKPHERYQGLNAQQLTMFVLDLSGNAIEFKSFKDATQVFT